MKYQHRFQVKAPVTQVAAFHQETASMAAITPPPIRVRVHQAPPQVTSGSEMSFTLWLGPLPIHWTARFEAVDETGFIDRQVSGPFGSWVHRHSFAAVDENTTEVNDEIALELHHALIWRLVGLGFAAGLPVLFAYRAWKTRRLLEARRAA